MLTINLMVRLHWNYQALVAHRPSLCKNVDPIRFWNIHSVRIYIVRVVNTSPHVDASPCWPPRHNRVWSRGFENKSRVGDVIAVTLEKDNIWELSKIMILAYMKYITHSCAVYLTKSRPTRQVSLTNTYSHWLSRSQMIPMVGKSFSTLFPFLTYHTVYQSGFKLSLKLSSEYGLYIGPNKKWRDPFQKRGTIQLLHNPHRL